MLRFKLFSGSQPQIEEAINTWLAEFEPDVTHMTQTADGDGSVTVSFLFEESFRGQERRLSEEHGMTRAEEPAIPSSEIPDEPLHVPQEPGQITSRQ
jgi:hypothetical protein